MLERIFDALHADPEDDYLSLSTFEVLGEDALIRIRIMSDDGAVSGASIRARGLTTYVLKDPDGDLSVEADHVLARPWEDAWVDVSFLGRPLCAHEVIGRLHATHRRIAGRWIPFDRYLNAGIDLAELLDGGYGTFAEGPRFLLDAYADVLRASGLSVTSLPRVSPRTCSGRSPSEEGGKLWTLRLGGAHFVAHAFEEVDVEI